MHILIGIQARTDSQRFPRKIYEEISGKPMLSRVVSNCFIELPPKIAKTTVAVLGPDHDKEVENFCRERTIQYYGFPGDENDLMARYMGAVEMFQADAVIRVTGDCPFIPRAVVQRVAVGLFSYDYVSNTITRTMPEGWDCQGVSKEALGWFNKTQTNRREHPFVEFDSNAIIRETFVSEGFKLGEILDNKNPALLKTSVDTKEDLKVANEYAKQLEFGQKS